MRFFIALDLSRENSRQVQDIQTLLSTQIPQVKLTDSTNLHLTLAYVGEQPDQYKDKITEVIKNSCKGIPPFTVSPSFIDGFPDIHSAQVLWLGLKGEVGNLFVLRERIKDGLIDLRLVVDERRFSPHITIGKLSKTDISAEVEKRLQDVVNFPFSPIHVNSIKLFQSIAQNGVHTHNILSETKLG